METRSIYRSPRYDYERELSTIEKWATTPYNRKKIISWHNHLSAKEAGKYRICKLSAQIRRLLLVWHNVTDEARDLSTIDKHTFEQVVGWINNKEGWTLATRSDYRRCIKQFFGWYEEIDPRLQELPEIDILTERDEQIRQHRARQEARKHRSTAQEFYRYLAKHVKRNYKAPEYKYSDIITDADIRAVIAKGVRNSRDRALLGILHETGLRAGELINLKIKDLEHLDDRVVLHVTGKTGARPVPIILYVPYLLRWLDDHPNKESAEAYLWVGLSSRNGGKPLFHSAVTRMVDKAFKRAGVEKKHNLHWFRHSRATLLYGRLTDGELRDFMGWAIGSDMVKTYAHTKNEGAQKGLNRIYNIKSREQEEILLTCVACGLHNTHGSIFCGRCQAPLTSEAHHSKETYTNLAFDMIKKIMSDPKLKKEFEQYANNKEQS